MRNKRLRKVIAVIAMMAVLLTVAGCGARTPGPGQSPNQSAVNYEVDLTYVNLAYIDSGDEMIDKFVDDVEQIISVEAMDTKEAQLSFAVMEAIELLKTVPDRLSDRAVTCVSDRVPVKNVQVTSAGPNAHCVVDIDGAGAMEMDSYTEMFFIYQIADTILDSFDSIESVSFTVDGKEVDGLNHMDLSKPFTDDVLDRFEGND